jgi:hypothetical protein
MNCNWSAMLENIIKTVVYWRETLEEKGNSDGFLYRKQSDFQQCLFMLHFAIDHSDCQWQRIVETLNNGQGNAK